MQNCVLRMLAFRQISSFIWRSNLMSKMCIRDRSNFLKPSQFFAVSRDAGENEAEAVKVVNYLLNSEDANKILLGERGVPASSVVASAKMCIRDRPGTLCRRRAYSNCRGCR